MIGEKYHSPVYLIDGARTPFLKVKDRQGPFTPVDLSVQCGRPLLLRQPFAPSAFDEVILGCVNVVVNEMNPARVAALRLGIDSATAFTVQINCGSGMQSIDTAFKYIRSGSADLILAGGTEALSHAPLIYSKEVVEWFSAFTAAKGFFKKTKVAASIPIALLNPVIGLKRGLTDPITDLNMGQTAEVLGHMFDISRKEADQYAVSSHLRLSRAQEEGWLDEEITPVISRDGDVYDKDNGVRADTSIEKLSQLKPVFEKPWGQVTPGNASQITDGASWVILASELAVKQHNLTPCAQLIDSAWSALDPSIMGLGPVLCTNKLFNRNNLDIGDIDLWEINEAFATQVLACLAAFEDYDFCTNVLGLDEPLGKIDRTILNVNGGAIALGHPVGTSGNRIVLHLINTMKRLGHKRGIATECIGGGQGGAMLVEII